jgi:hypothetical protein
MSETAVQETTPQPAAPPEQVTQPEAAKVEQTPAEGAPTQPQKLEKKPSVSAETNRARELERRHAKEKEQWIAETKALREQYESLKPLEKLKNAKELAKNDVLAFIEAAGFSPEEAYDLYNNLTPHVLEGFKKSGDAQTKREIANIKKKLAEQEKQREEQEAQRKAAEAEAYQDHVLSNFTNQFVGGLEQRKDNYPYAAIDPEYSAQVALHILDGYFKENGYDAEPPGEKLLEYTEAALEKAYELELAETESRLSKVKFAKERKASPKSNSEKSIEGPKKPVVPNNSMSANVTRSTENKVLTAEERRAYQIAEIQKAMDRKEQ